MLLSVFTLATCVAVGLAVYNPNDPNCEYTQGSWNGNLLIERLHPNTVPNHGGPFFDQRQNIDPMRHNIRTSRWKRSSYRSNRSRNRWNTYRRNRNWNSGQWNRGQWDNINRWDNGNRGQWDNFNRWDNGWDSNLRNRNWNTERHY